MKRAERQMKDKEIVTAATPPNVDNEADPNKDSGLHKVERVLRVVRDGSIATLILAAAAFLIQNAGQVDTFIERALGQTTQIKLGSFVHLTLDEKSAGPIRTNYSLSYASDDALKLVEASFFGSSDLGEYVEVEALRSVNLGGGPIGDSRTFRSLSRGSIPLHAGERLRIYITSPKPHPPIGTRYELAWCQGSDHAACRGFLSATRTRGDRVVVLDTRQNVLMRVDYWRS